MTKELRAKMEAECRAIEIKKIINNGMTIEKATAMIKQQEETITYWENRSSLDPSGKVAFAKGQIKHWEEIISVLVETVELAVA